MAGLSDKSIVVPVIAGLTASGKSGLALRLADTMDGEIINADSMQIYQGFDIGTAKASNEEQTRIPHHLIDILDATEIYSVARFVEDAAAAIRDIAARGKLPIVCGGTAQYTTALLRGTRFWPLNISESIERSVDQRVESAGYEALLADIARLDPETAKRLSVADQKRIRRFMLVYEATGKTRSEMNAWANEGEPLFSYLPFCLAPEPEIIYPRIDERTRAMYRDGLVAETQHLLERYGDPGLIPFSGIGYRHTVSFLMKELSESDMIDMTMRDTRRYAKRQRTWYRHHDHGSLFKNDEIESGFWNFQRQIDASRR